MKNEKALKLAIECIKAEIQRLAVDGNLQEMYQANLPHTIAASKRRALLREALATLVGQQSAPIMKSKSPSAKPRKVENQPDLFADAGIGNCT